MKQRVEYKNPISVLIDSISGIFLPIVNLLSAAGIMKGILAILVMTNILNKSSDTYLVLNAMGDSLFYFLPIFLAYTSAKKFNADPFTAVVIAGVMLYPSLTTVMEKGETVHFLTIPLRGVTYHSSVIPIILAVGLLYFVEKFLNKALPEVVRGFLTPLISILVVSTVTLFAFGPIGAVIGDTLAMAYEFVYKLSPIIAGALLGAAIQPMVIFGFHWAFILIGMNNIMVNGRDTVLALMGPPVFAQAGAALAVMLKTRDKSFKSICASAAISAMFGITEPAMFGVNLPRKKPMIAVCIGGGIGGAVAGLSGAQAMSFAFPSLAALPIFYGNGFGLYIISCAAGFASAFVLTLLMHFDADISEEKQENGAVAAMEGVSQVQYE